MSSKLYTNPVLLLMFARLHVTTLSVNQCVLISQRDKKLNFGEEINNQCYTCYVDVLFVMLRLCNAVSIFFPELLNCY